MTRFVSFYTCQLFLFVFHSTILRLCCNVTVKTLIVHVTLYTTDNIRRCASSSIQNSLTKKREIITKNEKTVFGETVRTGNGPEATGLRERTGKINRLGGLYCV